MGASPATLRAVFFDSWSGLARVVLVGVPAYVVLIAMLRVAGKRSLAKLNAFDLIVTIALGSTLASVLLSSSVALAEGVSAMALLLGMQFAVAWVSSRSPRIEGLVKSEPTLLYRNGPLHDAMRRERVSGAELLQVARREGRADLSEVAAIVLESDGSFSVLGEPPHFAT